MVRFSIVLFVCLAGSLSFAAENVTFHHACDGSAAVSLPIGLLNANDESNTLTLHGPDGETLGRGDLVAPIEAALGRALESRKGVTREIDIEGAARADDRIYWIGSHGTNKAGKPRPNRRLFFATNVPAAAEIFDLKIIGKPVSLYEAIVALPKWGEAIGEATTRPAPGTATPRTPKQGSLNIEALAIAPEQGLLVGLRAPLFNEFDANLLHDPTRGVALLIFLRNPAQVLEDGQSPQLDAVTIDLDDRGVRGLLWSPEREAWLILAGRVGGPADFVLYEWKGPDHEPRRFAVTLEGRPETLVRRADGLFLLSDDGTQQADGEICKDRLASFLKEHRKQPFAEVPLPPGELSFHGYSIDLSED